MTSGWKILPIAVFVALAPGQMQAAYAATINAADCSRQAVNNAVNTAQTGDTVLIPPGTCTWTQELTIGKGITLTGSGIDQTILIDNVSKPGRLLTFQANSPYRLSSLTIQGQATDPGSFNQGHVGLQGTSKAFRVDNVKFANQQTVGIRVSGDQWGVIDSCEFVGSFKQGIFVSHDGWGGHSYGDGSWAAPLTLGTDQAVYIEDNIFTDTSGLASGALDALDGARVVFRYNTLNGQFVATHGTESGQRRRSIRSFEIYNNTMNHNLWFTALYIRGGTGVIFNNTASGYTVMWKLANFRTNDPFPPWGLCNGTSPYDQNSGSPGGYRCVDQPGAGTSNLLAGATPASQWVGNQADPIYIWNNSPNSGGSDSSHVVLNRDYIVGSARPGYAPYAYPHPLRAGGSSVPPPTAPTNVRIVSP